MPDRFAGFPDGKIRSTPIPEQFFIELLSQIQDITVLKICFFTFYLLNQIEGDFRNLHEDDYIKNKALIEIIGGDRSTALKTIKTALREIVSIGFLLKVETSEEGSTVVNYFLNSAKGRAAVEAINSGEWQPSVTRARIPDRADRQINIYQLYEEHIGPLSPMISEALLEAEEAFPADWIEDAIRIAVENNVRRWRYVQTILDNWKDEGRDERKHRRDSEEDRRRYITGKYAEFIEHGDE